jgi:hypothetical protein
MYVAGIFFLAFLVGCNHLDVDLADKHFGVADLRDCRL